MLKQLLDSAFAWYEELGRSRRVLLGAFHLGKKPGNFGGSKSGISRVSMGLTDRRKTAINLVDSRKNWKILTVSRKWGKKELTVKEIVP